MASQVPEEFKQGEVDEATLSPVGGDVKTALEKGLSKRPEERELVERNIIKDPKIAPSLQAAQADLKRHQLEDKLEHAVAHRPTSDELVKKGILSENEAPDDPAAPAEKIEPPSIA